MNACRELIHYLSFFYYLNNKYLQAPYISKLDLYMSSSG